MLKERFAPITPSLADKLNSINPAAYKLWVWLRQEHRPDVEFNFNVHEAAEVIGCTTRWIRVSLQKLSSVGLIKEIDRWGRAMYRLVLFQPTPLKEGELEKMNKRSVSDHERSIFSSSNPDSSTPYQREFSEEKHGVSKEQREDYYEEYVSPAPKPEAKQPLENTSIFQNPQELLFAEVLGVAPNFNPQVFLDGLARFGETQIRNAISAVQEQIERGNIRTDPARMLYAAIYKGFTSNQSKAISHNKVSRRTEKCEAAVIGSAMSENCRAMAEPISPSWQIFEPDQEERRRIQAWTEQQEASLRASIPPQATTSTPIDEDCSDILTQISIAIMLLQWDRQQVRQTIQKRYGVSQQAYLSLEQLKNWLDYLRSTTLG